MARGPRVVGDLALSLYHGTRAPHPDPARTFVLYRIAGPTGLFYFGITDDFPARISGHRSSPPPRLVGDLRKHGWAAFTIEAITPDMTDALARVVETDAIRNNRTAELGRGYNTLSGPPTSDRRFRAAFFAGRWTSRGRGRGRGRG